MLAAITDQLREALVTRKVPFEVVYGPDRNDASAFSGPRIVIERDREAGDEVLPPRTGRKNPSVIYTRVISARARIFAQSTMAGATSADHERLADQVVDHLLVALREIIVARKNAFGIGNGGLLTAEQLDADGLRTWPGAVYEQPFTVDRGVLDTVWAGEAAAGTEATEAEAGGVTGFTIGGVLDVSDSPASTTDLPGSTTR